MFLIISPFLKTYLINLNSKVFFSYSKKNTKSDHFFGNLNISREWNWADEQIIYMMKFLTKKPQDFILSNGKSYTAKKIADKLGVQMHTIIIEICVVLGGSVMIYRALTF